MTPLAAISMKKTRIFGLVLIGALIIAATQISIFTVGDKRRGSTRLVHRSGDLSYLHLIDSERAVCRDGRSSFSRGADRPGANTPFGPLAILGRKDYCEMGVTLEVGDSDQVLLVLPYLGLFQS